VVRSYSKGGDLLVRFFDKEMRYVFVVGGVVSSIGKGITLASLGYLLKVRNFEVNIQKLDPYINLNPGNMNPFQHGEIFVTDDGLETDLDIGHYERFLDISLNQYSNITAGRVYKSVIEEERAGLYDGNTVQVVPHITDKIKNYIFKSAVQSKNSEIISLHEIGGTVGDIESLPFFEAIRQLVYQLKSKVYTILISYIPEVGPNREMKTKPTQHSVAALRSIGIQSNVLICRSRGPISDEIKNKISNLTGIEKVYNIYDAKSIYSIPKYMHREGIDRDLLTYFGYDTTGMEKTTLKPSLVRSRATLQHTVRIALVGKYTEGADAYLSLTEAVKIAARNNGCKLELAWLSVSDTYKKPIEELMDYDGVIVPGGFGVRGIDEKIRVIQLCRERKMPLLGICMGMQCMLIEYALNVIKLQNAGSEEMDDQNRTNIIVANNGRKMVLGGVDIDLEAGTSIHQLYGSEKIRERHRHRYKFDYKYKKLFEENGLIISGISQEDGKEVAEFIELLDKEQFYIGVQAHPEFTARPSVSHPLFDGFIKATVGSES
jgi:CTP synthase